MPAGRVFDNAPVACSEQLLLELLVLAELGIQHPAHRLVSNFVPIWRKLDPAAESLSLVRHEAGKLASLLRRDLLGLECCFRVEVVDSIQHKGARIIIAQKPVGRVVFLRACLRRKQTG